MKIKILILLIYIVPVLGISQVIEPSTDNIFDPVEILDLPGTTIIGSPTITGKEVIVKDINDGTNMTLIIRTPSADTVANPSYPNLLTLGSTFKLNINEVNDTVFIREDDLGVNGRIGHPGYAITTATKLEFIYTVVGWIEKLPSSEVEIYVDTYNEIKLRNFNLGDRIVVRENNDFSVHIVQSNNITGFNASSTRGVIQTKNALYAHLQPVDGKIYVTHMGAVGNGSTINDDAFQLTVKYCIESGISSHIFAPKGHYKFDKGFYLGDLGGGLTGISISGNAPTYTNDSDTRFSTDSTNNFIIGVIGSRNIFIENIDFRGPSNIWTSKEVAERTINWDSYYRTNSNSPFAAIVIDPFYNAVSTADRYPDWVSSYPVATSTSQVTIRNCSIRYFESAIVEDPTAQNFNGDNIKLENSRIERCRKVWYSRSSQARANSIENCYITFVETVIDNAANGDFPRLEEINGAGFIYQIFNVDGEFGRVIVNNSHFESFMSFGLIDVPEAEFSNCIFKFDLNYGRVPITLNGSTPVTFRGCEIRNFSNCNTITYFSHKTRLKFIDCTIEALEFMKGNDQDRSLRANNEVFVNTYFVCYDSYVSNSDFKKFDASSEDISGQLASQNSIYSINGNLFQVNDYPYAFRNIEVNTNVKKYTVNSNRYGYYFTTNNPSRHRVNDVIWSRESTNGVLICIGTVKNISNDTVFTDFPSYFLNPTFDTTSVNLLHRRHRKFFSPILVEVKIGSDTVKILDYAGQDSGIFTVGDKLGSFENYYNESLSGDRVTPNIYIKSIDNNGTHDYLIINQAPNATISSTDTVYLSDAPYLTKQWSTGTTNSYIPNGIIAASNSNYILMSNNSGIVGSSISSPTYDTIWYGKSYADLNLLEYTAGLIDGGKFSPALTLDSSLIIKSDNGLIRFEEEDGNLIGSLGASISGGIGLLQWGEWFFVSKGSIHAGISDFQDSTTFNNTSDPNARVIVNIPMEIDNGQDIVDESDQEFKVPFGRDKGQETDVNLNLGSVLARSGHMSFEYTSRVTSGAVANNVIWIDTLGQNIKHMLDIYITAIDESATYNVKVRTAGVDSIFIRDTLVSEYILQDDQTLHIKAIKTGGNNVYKVINPEKKGSYTNSSGSNQTVITITHNLGVTPNIIYITPTTDVGTWYVSNKNPTEIEITMSTGLANTASLQWFVDR